MAEIYSLGGWDLSVLAPHHETPMFNERLKEIDETVRDFENRKSLLKNEISSGAFYETLHIYEEIAEEMSRIRHYANLLFWSDTSNPKSRAVAASIADYSAKIANRTIFFDLWWKKGIDEENTERLLKEAGHLTNYLKHSRELAKYTLTEPEERIINIKDTTGSGFVRKLHDQYTERFVFSVTLDGKKQVLTQPELIALVHSPDLKKRRAAYRALLRVYSKNEDILGELYRSIVMDWKNEAIDLRGYKSPISVRNMLNDVPDEAVQTLLSVCRKNRVVFQDFFKEKARMIGMKKMSRYHIYAPIDAVEKDYPFHEGVRTVLDSLEAFSPLVARLAKKVLDEAHLDSEVRKGKRSGAFCATASPKITPFVLVNYTGNQTDVFTVAHELGHAVHSLLASDKSILVQRAPLPLAELASVFSEMILLDRLLETASQEEKKRLIATQLNDMYATIMRQAYFTVFEGEAHRVISEGATVIDVSDVYMGNLKEQFGRAVEVHRAFRHEWTYIPHFFHEPFYTYAYSFGNLLTVALYRRYKEEGTNFLGRYVDILSAGGSRNPAELLEDAEIDIRSEKLWQDGFDYVKERREELQSLR